MFHVVLLLGCLGISGSLFAGTTGKIAGTIVDAKTGEPLPGANVVLVGTQLGTASDMNGDFFILNVFPGVYDVSVSYMGYITERRTLVRVMIDKTSKVDFSLKPLVLHGETIIVVAQAEEKVEKDLTATKQSYDVSSLESIAGMNDVGDIINLQADVDNNHFRGGRAGEALYMIDGATIVNPLNNNQAFEPLTIGLEQVEVYTSGFSAEYGNVQSGVINMVAKEGNPVKWETYFDVSSTNSYYKTWGANVYSEAYNEYFDMLNSSEEWAFEEDPTSGKIMWTHFGILFPEHYLPDMVIEPGWPPDTTYASTNDSLRAGDLVKKLWLQSIRDLGLGYASPDYRLEFSLNGPFNDNMTLFVAGRQNVVQPFLPTGRANVHRQVISNLTFKPNMEHKIKLIYNFDNSYSNDFTTNYYRWFERVLNVSKTTENVHQFGVNWTYLISPATFLDINLNHMTITEKDRIDLLADSVYSELYSTGINWRDYTAPNGYQIGKMETSSSYEKSRTLFFNGSLTSQVNKYNLLKSGLQFTQYDISVDNTYSQSNVSNIRLEDYHVYPYEGALYVQDKMEFEDLVANIGLRLDFYNLNTEYYLDKFSPYRNPNFDVSDQSKGAPWDESLAAKEKSKLKYVFQPRIGIAFPVSEQSVLHLNYGVFTQRPAFEYIFGQRSKLESIPDYERLGNPLLEPERTISYDLGIVRALPAGFHLDVSAYLKDVSNLIQYAIYEDDGGNRYFTFDNREYADIKGFHVNVQKSTGFMRGYLRYNWEAAKGKSASAIGSGARAEYFESDTRENILPAPDDVYLDYNRLHKMVFNLSMHTSSETGFAIGSFNPLGNITINGTYKFSSGRPFTWDISGQGLQMNRRTPEEHSLNIRIEKSLALSTTPVRVYLEIFNVLNQKVFYYSRVFQDPQNEQNIFKERYMTDRKNLLTQTDFSPYVTSLDGYLYTNQPRHFRFGVNIKF